MSIRAFFAVFLVCVSASNGLSQQFSLQTDAGSVFMRTPDIASWGVVGNGATVAIGDSLRLSGERAAIQLTADSRLMLRDSCRLAVTGSDEIPVFALMGGEVFLDRAAGDAALDIVIMAQGCTFRPEGTAFAVKITPRGDPSVAVIRGKVQAADPAGQTTSVTSGSFATFEMNARSFRKDDLPPDAITRLESWSGVAHEPYTEEVAAAESSENDDTGDEPQPNGDQPAMDQDATDQPDEAPVEAVEVVSDPGEQNVMKMEEPKSAPATTEEQDAPEAAASPAPGADEEQQARQPASAAGSGKASEDSEKSKKEAAAAAPKQKKAAKRSSSTASAGGSVNDAAQKASADQQGKEKPEDATKDKSTGDAEPGYELSTGMVTVDDEQWTRIAFMIDVPIWRFGVAFDLELFLNSQGQFSDKSWDFSKDGWAESLARKIRYIRFNREGDPVFVKLGALKSVTMGYGFVVDRFTNMLNYPDEKLIGLQFDLNDISPIGITLETVVADFLDFRDDGGVVAGRLGVRPLKPTSIPILSGLLVAGTFATDLNQYAPARSWDYSLIADSKVDSDLDNDNMIDSTFWYRHLDTTEQYFDGLANDLRDVDSLWDPKIEHADKWASREENRFSIVGGDVSIPLISSKLVGLDIYGQGAMTHDDEDGDVAEGWGIGAPGAKLSVGPLWAQAEYRKIKGEFQPGYFGPYYFDQRIQRYPSIVIKEQSLEDANLNGIFGALGLNIADFFSISATYQNLLSPEGETNRYGDRIMDQRFEATAGVGNVLLERIPKLNKAEAFAYKTDIMRTDMSLGQAAEPEYDRFFEKTDNMYWGYRVGAEVMAGASIIWETRYGWKWENGELVEDNNVLIQAGLAF